MKLYKLTDKDGVTGHGYVETKWRRSFEPPRLTGQGGLCGPGWYHAYTSPELAVMMDPMHGKFGEEARCFEVYVQSGDVGDLNNGLKVGFRTCVTGKEVELPEVTPDMRVAFGILCAKEATPESSKAWHTWAREWLSGEDRTATSAAAAAAEAAVEAVGGLNLDVLALRAIENEERSGR